MSEWIVTFGTDSSTDLYIVTARTAADAIEIAGNRQRERLLAVGDVHCRRMDSLEHLVQG